MELELERLKNIHLVGVGGCGMSGIAKVLLEMGFKVSGSDQKEGVNTIRLKDLGVKIFIDHESSQVRDADILVYSSAVKPDNPELVEAAAKGIKIVRRACWPGSCRARSTGWRSPALTARQRPPPWPPKS